MYLNHRFVGVDGGDSGVLMQVVNVGQGRRGRGRRARFELQIWWSGSNEDAVRGPASALKLKICGQN